MKRTRSQYTGSNSATTTSPGQLQRAGTRRADIQPDVETGVAVESAEVFPEEGFDTADALQDFLGKYPVDERAYSFLLSSNLAVQQKVMREFMPLRLGEKDYSRLLMSFIKKCGENEGRKEVRPTPVMASVPSSQRRSSTAGCTIDALPAGGCPQDLATALATPGLDTFFDKYPVDERAYEYFATSPPAVQLKVLREFQPLRHGENSYSGLFTSFLKKCRATLGGGDAGGYGSKHVYETEFSGVAEESPEEQLLGSIALELDSLHAEILDLEGFRAKFPMDDRAFDYLCRAPGEVQARVLESFMPPRLDDSDFSAPVTAYIRSLRNHHAEVAATTTEPSSTEDAVTNFFEQYPCDSRATDYFTMSSPEVQLQVIQEFRPRAKGETDYSAAVTSFIKRCRNRSSSASSEVSHSWQTRNWRPPLKPLRPTSRAPPGGWGPSKRPRLG